MERRIKRFAGEGGKSHTSLKLADKINVFWLKLEIICLGNNKRHGGQMQSIWGGGISTHKTLTCPILPSNKLILHIKHIVLFPFRSVFCCF